jgi:tetratricopeptide (TPR) repeat protein
MESAGVIVMKKTHMLICLGVVLSLCAVAHGAELPFSETVELKSSEDHYDLENLIIPIYIKENHTYKTDARVVMVSIAPQDYCLYQNTEYREYFCDILVKIVISTSDGDTVKDFESYLNFDIANQRLFWDHAGHSRADRAGQALDEDHSLEVQDQYVEVSLALTHLTPSEYNCGDCQTDASSYINFVDTLRFRLDITYTESQLDAQEDMQDTVGETQDAQVYITQAQQYFQQEEFEKAREQYQEAKDIFDEIGDDEKAQDMQELIDKCLAYDSAKENFKEGTQLFEEASRTNNYQEATDKYQQAKSYFQRAKTEFTRAEDETQADLCDNWIDRCDDEIENLKGVGTLRDRLLYIIIAIVVVAGAGVAIKSLGKGKGAGKGKSKGKGKEKIPQPAGMKEMTLTVRNTETGQTTIVQVTPQDKIGKVRQIAATNLGIVPSALSYEGKPCPPAHTVEECGLTSGSTVDITPAGKEPTPRDEKGEKLEILEQRYREGKISRELYESLKKKLEQ